LTKQTFETLAALTFFSKKPP